jgi:uncharacterized membrane protein YkoI
MHYLITILLLLSLLVTGSAMGDRDDDHERVYRARQDAAILPLEEILDRLNLRSNVRILEVEYEREDGMHLYEIEYLTGDGDVYEIEVDATSGVILKQERD